jgi:urease accessory protein
MLKNKFNWRLLGVTTTAISLMLIMGKNALAHHPMGGETPSNFFEGFMSGLGHPIIGLDHFAFVASTGLIAAGEFLGLIIPIAFVLSTMLGTLIHVQELNLPFPEVVIALSVIIFGVLLVIKKASNNSSFVYTFILGLMAALAGIFHGYAYGEAIIGAEMTPLLAYLAGFIIIQLTIALGSLAIGNICLTKFADTMRFAGFAIGAIGLVFLAGAV